MSNVIKQRMCIKFCFCDGITATKALKMLKCCKKHLVTIVYQKQEFEWYKMFKEARECFEDEPNSGRPSTDEHIAPIIDLVLNDCHLTIRDIIEHVLISFGSCQAILKDNLGLQYIVS
ncbi:putative uncharacterized protein FLJ37770 [Centruroides sculpturatus]|uniref:putative uncharacterized protein FLJ37770 n=1 Tax=Centruroides sculpturatus TaxID=218467 RepID=UPI000C6E9DF7|nr:putative uncharacterized protein FLJ37770 [Centruroides sculpturatus]